MYAILFIPDASYLYNEKERENTPDHYAVDAAQAQCLYTEQETRDPDRCSQIFDLMLFENKAEAEKRFTKTFWKEAFPDSELKYSAYIEYDGKDYSLTNEQDRIYFEIVEIKE